MKRLLLGVVAGCVCAAVAMVAIAKDAPERRRFASIIEPSGVAQLPDGRILVVDDQPSTPLTTLTLGADLSVSETAVGPGLVAGLLGRDPFGSHVDLEAIEVAPDGLTYVATSHSRDDSGRRQDDREKLTALRLREDRVAEAAVFADLRVAIGALDGALKKAAHERDVKDEGGLNIEALSMGPDGALLIGLRTPVIGGDAVILALENPVETVIDGAVPRFRPDPVRLDLGGGGVRAMTWHPVLGGHLIGSRREDKGGKRFRLWFWSGDARDAPRPVEIAGDPDLEKLEGVARLTLDGRELVMLVFDSGDRKRGRGGEYMILPLEALSVR